MLNKVNHHNSSTQEKANILKSGILETKQKVENFIKKQESNTNSKENINRKNTTTKKYYRDFRLVSLDNGNKYVLKTTKAGLISHVYCITKKKKNISKEELINIGKNFKYNIGISKISQSENNLKVLKHVSLHQNKINKNKILGINSKNPNFEGKYTYINSKGKKFIFQAKKGYIIKVRSFDGEEVNPSQKGAIQKFINQKKLDKFKEVKEKKVETIQRINSIQKKESENIKNILDNQNKYRLKLFSELYENIEEHIYTLMKFNYSINPSSQHKKSSELLLLEISKIIPKAPRDKNKSNQKLNLNEKKALFNRLIKIIDQYTQPLETDTDEIKKLIVNIRNGFLAAKFILGIAYNKENTYI